jgi:hypothetical protein
MPNRLKFVNIMTREEEKEVNGASPENRRRENRNHVSAGNPPPPL